jgi:hypothetical protein
MVFFADKTGTPHSISSPATFLSTRAVERRDKMAVVVNTEDLPVTPSYVTQVRATGAKAFFTTRWMNGVLVEATAAQLIAIESLPFVSSTEFVAPNQRLLGGRKRQKFSSKATSTVTSGQLHMLGLDTMHAAGYRGEGVMIAIFDSGFFGVDTNAPFQSVRNGSQIKMTTDFVTNSSNVYQFDDHGTNIFSIIAAETTSFEGGATKADYLLFVTEDVPTEYRIEEYNWLFAAERADSAGADIIQGSVGYNTFDDASMDYSVADLNSTTAVVTKAANFARDRGMVVVVSAGNEGASAWEFITPPADATGILAVGAITNGGVKASFSSVGPTANGQIKPDVVALGVGVSVIAPDGHITTADGTSAAAPLVTSLVAGLIQLYPDKSSAELVKLIKSTATLASNPGNSLGHGIPTFQAVRNYLERQSDQVAYPNPFTNTLWISLQTNDPTSISIRDVQGKVIMNFSLPAVTWANSPLPIDVSSLSPGVYLLQILIEYPTATASYQSLIVKH